jgi:hypothetical protein
LAAQHLSAARAGGVRDLDALALRRLVRESVAPASALSGRDPSSGARRLYTGRDHARWHAGLVDAGGVLTATERADADLAVLAEWRRRSGRGDSAPDLRQEPAQTC